jgi:hypothetical protein
VYSDRPERELTDPQIKNRITEIIRAMRKREMNNKKITSESHHFCKLFAASHLLIIVTHFYISVVLHKSDLRLFFGINLISRGIETHFENER